MRFITRDDIETWADTKDCKYYLSHLIHRLVLATLEYKNIEYISFQHRKVNHIGKVSGELITQEQNMFIPMGASVWELDITKNKKKNTDQDYEKKKSHLLSKKASKITYIMVNAKRYRDKKKWVTEKIKERFWEDVRYLDAVDLEQWLELAPTVALWLAEILKKTIPGIYSLEKYWENLNEKDFQRIYRHVLLRDARVNEIKIVKSFLTNSENVLYIKSMALDEGISFSLAVFKDINLPDTNHILVINTQELFTLVIESRLALIILVKFKIEPVRVKEALKKGHKLIIALSPGEEVNDSRQIELPKVSEDYLNQYSYLFHQYYPEFIEGIDINKDVEKEEKIAEKRNEFINEVVKRYGINKVFDLSLQSDHPYLYGCSLAFCDHLNSKDQLKIYKLIASSNSSHLSLSSSFIGISENITGLKKQEEVLNFLIKGGLSKQGVVNFLCALHGSIDLWRYISQILKSDIDRAYWQSQERFLYTGNKEELFYALDKLFYYNKHCVFLNTLGKGVCLHGNNLNTEEVMKALEKVTITEIQKESALDLSLFTHIWEFLYQKDDYDIDRIAEMEMKLISVFTKIGTHFKPKGLFFQMSKNPHKYFELLCTVCFPEKELNKDALKDLKKEIKYQSENKVFIKALWQILNSFNCIPSIQKNASLKKEELKKWITEVRKLGKDNNRVKITDHYVGKLLAKYPISIIENKGFAIEIYDMLEEINTEEIKIAFHTQLLNYMGYTDRGRSNNNIKWVKSHFFARLFKETQTTHPHVSCIFKDLEEIYKREGKNESHHGVFKSKE
ncbi:hypothetical protein [Elizabethkingia anophelis]|uniref:hypothetical protein n=1 Tax=Elizabethkingia anophelis TaxID=1117645 RepID=UPI00389139BA